MVIPVAFFTTHDSPLTKIRKVAGYGWPGRSAKAVLVTEMRVRLPCLPLDTPMVKRTSFLASNEGFRVRVLVGVLLSPVVQWAGRPRDMGKIAGSNPAGTIVKNGDWLRRSRAKRETFYRDCRCLSPFFKRDGVCGVVAWHATL